MPVLRSTNFRDDGFIDLSDVAYREVPSEKIDQKRLQEGDLLLESSGGSPNKPVGRVVIVDGDILGDYLCTNFLRRLRPREDRADAHFLLYLLWNLHRTGGTKVFQHQTTGIRNLNYKEYLRWEHAVPPLPEQRKIAAVLSSVDDAIAATTDCMVSPAYVVAKPGDRIFATFARFLFKAPKTIGSLFSYSHGITRDRLRLYFDNFVEVTVALPPLQEQR